MFSKFNKNNENNRIIIKEKEFKLVKYRVEKERRVLNFYFEADKKTYYFKANSVITLDEAEVLSSLLASKLGLQAANMHFATFVNSRGYKLNGVISPDFVEDRNNTEVLNGKTLIEKAFLSVFNNSLENYIYALKKFKNNTNLLLGGKSFLYFEKDLALNLKKHMLFYFLIANQDMSNHNVEFLVKKDSSNNFIISLAPVFDNSFSFLLKCFRDEIYDSLTDEIDEFDKNLINMRLNTIPYKFQVKVEDYGRLRRDTMLPNLAKLLLCDKELYEFYQEAKQIKLGEFFFEKKNQLNLTAIRDKSIRLADAVFEDNISALEKALERQKTIQDTPLNIFNKNLNKNSFELER